MEIKNPVIQEMLNELCGESPDFCLLIHQWLETPPCLRLLHFLDSRSHSWLTSSDLAWWIGDGEDQTRSALHCLVGQGFAAQREVPEVGMTFYRLADQKPGQEEKIARLRDWYRRWQAQLEDASQMLGRGWHGSERTEESDRYRSPG